MTSQQPPRLWARIDQAGLLVVSGLPEHPDDLQANHDEPGNAYAELVNLALDRAEQGGGPVWLHATTPTGVWGMAVHVDGTTVPLPLEVFDPTPTDSGQGLGTAPEAELEAALAAVGELSPPAAAVVLALAADPAPGVRAAAVAELSTWGDDPNTVIEADLDAEQLAALADCRLAWVRAGVAGHPRTDPITLDRLADDSDRLVVQGLAGRLDLPAELATALARHREPTVRAELGRNPAATFLLTLADPPPPPATSASASTAAVAVIDPPSTPGSTAPDHAVPLPPAGDGRTPGPSAPVARVRQRRMAGGIATGLLLITGSAVAWRTADTADHLPPAAPTAATSSALVAWQGTWLPTGPDGPRDPGAPAVAGFSRTPLGAAMAAAHLSVRIDPYAGPASFAPTITGHTYGGDPADLLERTQAAYDDRAGNAGVSGGGPIPTSTGRIVGWRAQEWVADGPVTVHLLVVTTAGHRVDYAIQVTWVEGDYRLVDPTSAGTFVTTSNPDPRTYTRF